MIDRSRTPIVQPGVYKHYKLGNCYEVLSQGYQTETEEALVRYRDTNNNEWYRPVSMFMESVQYDGQIKPRFEYMGPGPLERFFFGDKELYEMIPTRRQEDRLIGILPSYQQIHEMQGPFLDAAAAEFLEGWSWFRVEAKNSRIFRCLVPPHEWSNYIMPADGSESITAHDNRPAYHNDPRQDYRVLETVIRPCWSKQSLRTFKEELMKLWRERDPHFSELQYQVGDIVRVALLTLALEVYPHS